MKRAPQRPTSEELYMLHPLSVEASLEIDRVRQEYTEVLFRPAELTLGILGYCAQPGIENLPRILVEGRRVSHLSEDLDNCSTAHRSPPWKPRSNPNDWHGEETTNPEGAYRAIKEEAEVHARVAAEIGYLEMLGRYASMLSFGWVGSRNVENDSLIRAVALHDRRLPVGIKNGLNGDVEAAIAQVDLVNDLRQGIAAPAVLIFRGGSNFSNPDLWEKEYLHAYEITNGRMIVDAAHGSEMAHDPEGQFSKTKDGQISALKHIIYLASLGFGPAGVMIEASDLVSKTDPHIPLKEATDGLLDLVRVKRLQYAS